MNIRVQAAVELRHKNLRNLPAEFIVPEYDPKKVTAGIMHIGPSAFFRAHLAYFAHQQLNQAHRDGTPLNWGIRAVSLRSTDVRDALAPQDYLYSLTSKSKNPKHEIIGSIKDILCSREDTNEILEAAADPSIRVISLTVTQKGYYLTNSEDGQPILDLNNKDIQACLDPNNPELSSIGLLAHSLKLRKEKGINPPVILSCDNFPQNGSGLKNAVIGYANLIEKGLGDWIAKNVPFPDTMVDRITPKTDKNHVSDMAGKGIIDAWPVAAEAMPKPPFVVQLITDAIRKSHFEASGVLALSSQGIIFDEEIAPYENMKLRTLNGVHMALGCIGHLAGYAHADEAMQDPSLRAYAIGFMEEAGQTLKPVSGMSLDDFRAGVVERLDNPKMKDELTRLARNGVDKISGRLLNTLRDCVANEQPYSHHAFTLASWLHYTATLDEKGYLPTQQLKVAHQIAAGQKPDDPNDANSARLGLPHLIRSGHNIAGVFAMSDIFGKDFSARPDVVQVVQAHFDNIRQNGMKEALDMFLQEVGAPETQYDMGFTNTGLRPFMN